MLHFLIKWPDRDFIFGIIPPTIKKLFPRLTGIIDCFEIFVEAPSNLKARPDVVQLQKAHHNELSNIMQSSWSDQPKIVSDHFDVVNTVLEENGLKTSHTYCSTVTRLRSSSTSLTQDS